MTRFLIFTLPVAIGAALGMIFARQAPGPKPVIDSKMVNVVLTTMNIRAQTEFYERTLGFKIFYQDKTSCFLKSGGVNLVFVVTADKWKVTKNLCIDVAVKDLAAAGTALETAGVKVDKTDPNILKFTDHDGNTVEVVHG